MTASRYVFVLLALPALILATVGVFNYVVDPLQYFRRATFYAPHFSDNQRYQNPGIIRNFDYETVVLGTSHAENFLPSDIAATLGGTAVKLAISGSHVSEQSATLALALRQGRVRRVLWQIDFSSFTLSDSAAASPTSFPAHLYGSPLAAIVPYLFSLDTTTLSVEALTKTPANPGLETLNTWWNAYPFGPDRVLGEWSYMRERWTPPLRDFWLRRRASRPQMHEMFDRYVTSVIAAHPHVHFDLILPPQTFLDLANDLLIDDSRIYDRLQIAAWVRDAGQTYRNATVWDFQALAVLGDRFERFKDLAHFDRDTNLWMLRVLAAGTPPVAPPDAWVRPLLAYLRATCSPGSTLRERVCSPELDCARNRLQRWLDAGQSARPAIERETACLSAR